ncbi:MAG: S26 family signal peptidase [Acidobacteriota bacterium]|nr:S26 family signal peptidase [Acidobacteriota bacterium]
MAAVPDPAKVARQVILALALAAAGAGGLSAAFAPRMVTIQGRSMLPTLHPGDRALALGPPGITRFISAGDLVLAEVPGRRPGHRDLVIKRVERVLSTPQGRFFRLAGDNRARSRDSRRFGALPAAALRGLVIWRWAHSPRAGSRPAEPAGR